MIPYRSVRLRRFIAYGGLVTLGACGGRSGLRPFGDDSGGAWVSGGQPPTSSTLSGGSSGIGGQPPIASTFSGSSSGIGGQPPITSTFSGSSSGIGGQPPITSTFSGGSSAAGSTMLTTGGSDACGRACKKGWHCEAGECRAPVCHGTFTFGPRLIDFEYGSSPQLGAIAAADFNHDGLVDLAVTDYANSVVGVRLSQGNGQFGTAAFYPTGGSPGNLAVADFNGDGNLDLFTTDSSPEGNASVFLGDGQGAFAPKRDFALGGSIYQLAVGDINGDHIPDLITSSYPKATFETFFGNGDGTFARDRDYPLRQRIDSVAIEDLNGDQLSDVITLNWDQSAGWDSDWITIFLGNADGSLTVTTDLKLDLYAYELAIGDVNNDGMVDVIAAGEPDMEVLLGNGKGGFISFANVDGAGSPVLADLSDDGKLDIIAVNLDGLPEVTSVMLGTGDGTFKDSNSVTFAISAPPVIGDFDGDGIRDIAGIDHAQGKVAILSGKGDGTFADMVSIPDTYCPMAVALSDVNQDGDLDVLTATSSPSVRIYLNPIQSSSKPTTSWNVGGTPTQIIASDVDADGLTDLFTAYGGDSISFRFGTGPGTWSDPVNVLSNGLEPVTLADIDNDGLLDIVRRAPWYSGWGMYIWEHDGARAFQPNSVYTPLQNVEAFAVADLNGDNLADFVLAPAYASVAIALGTTEGWFSSPVEYAIPTPLDHVKVADVTGDGKLDVIGMQTDPAVIVVLPGNGDGSLGSGREYAFDGPGSSLIVYDVDGDRNLDIVTFSCGSAVLIKGNGTGDFSTSLVSPMISTSPTASHGSPVIGDLNGDGWPDLVFTNPVTCTTEVMFGRCR